MQVLQDMIGDLTGAPEPVVVKLFSPDADLLATWAPQVAEALEKVEVDGKTPIVDVEDGIENTTSGPAVVFTVNPEAAARAGFTPKNSARCRGDGGRRAGDRADAWSNGRPYPVRVRFPAAARASLEAMQQHDARELDRRNRDARLAGGVDELPGQTEIRRENLQQLVEVTARLEGVDMGTGIAAVQKTVADLKLPPSIRVEYGGTYQEQQKSFRDLAIVLALAVVLIFLVLLFEFRSFTRTGGHPCVGACCPRPACSSRCWSRGRPSTCRRSWA